MVPTAAGVRSRTSLPSLFRDDRVRLMGLSRRRIEYQGDVLVDVGAAQALQSFMGSEYSEAAERRASPSESGSTPTMGPHLERLFPAALTLIIKSVSNISRSDDRYPSIFCICLSFQRAIGLRPDHVTQPKRNAGPYRCRRFWLRIPHPFCAPTIGPNAPVSTTSPARERLTGTGQRPD